MGIVKGEAYRGRRRGAKREGKGERRATLRPFGALPFARAKGTESRSMRDERAHT